VLSINKYSFGTYLDLKQRSSLLPLGAHVLQWEQDYRKLMDLFSSVAGAYHLVVPAKPNRLLDFEYKKIEPGHLVVKQVRPVPLADQSRNLIPFLLNESGSWTVFQGEFGDVFGNHRLKSQWNFQAKNLRLTNANLQQSFYADAIWEYLDDGQLQVLSGAPSTWPNATHQFSEETAHDRWTLGADSLQRKFHLTSSRIRTLVSNAETPVQFLSDLDLVLSVEYPSEQPTIDFAGNPGVTTSDNVRLVPRPQRAADDILQERHITGKNGLSIRASFYWPKPPPMSAGYTAPLVDWVETRIDGLASEPIVLKGYYSQTYRPEHHNFSEHFIFEPRLEPGIPEIILAELEEKNIRLIHVLWDGESKISFLGKENKFRAP
jgi:hypothetical protein